MIITDDNVWELFQRADPARRPDIAPFTDAATYLEGLRTGDATVTKIDDAPSSRRPTWRGWPLARVAAVAAVIAAGALVLVNRDGERTATVEVATESVPEASPPMPYFVDLDTGARTALNSVDNAYDFGFQPSPDGTSRLFYQGGALSIADADGSGVIAIDVQGGLEWSGARWSPDSTRIVYQEREGSINEVGNLFVHEVATGRRKQVTDLELTTAGYYWLAPSFSPDGQTVVFHLARAAFDNPGFDVWSVPVTGGDPELLVEDAVWPMYLPDGGLVYATSPGDMMGDALVIAAADGSTRTLTEAVAGIHGVTVSPNGVRLAYGDEGVHVVEVESGEATMLEGTNGAGTWEWVDDHTLLIGRE